MDVVVIVYKYVYTLGNRPASPSTATHPAIIHLQAKSPRTPYEIHTLLPVRLSTPNQAYHHPGVILYLPSMNRSRVNDSTPLSTPYPAALPVSHSPKRKALPTHQHPNLKPPIPPNLPTLTPHLHTIPLQSNLQSNPKPPPDSSGTPQPKCLFPTYLYFPSSKRYRYRRRFLSTRPPNSAGGLGGFVSPPWRWQAGLVTGFGLGGGKGLCCVRRAGWRGQVSIRTRRLWVVRGR